MAARSPAYAHSLDGSPQSEWQPLDEHVKNVAAAARAYCAAWGGGDVAYAAGLWHDLGKYASDWQRFLQLAGSEAPTLGEEAAEGRRRHGPDHSTAGALHALRTLGERNGPGLVVRFVVAAHHAGLANQEDLRERLANPEKLARYERALKEAPADIVEATLGPKLPSFMAGTARTPSERDAAWLRFEMLVRMVLSAVADADFLDTERFMDRALPEGERRTAARPSFPPLALYRAALDEHLRRFDAVPQTRVNSERRRVLDWCLRAAGRKEGAFSLTVPTGGGKTLSALAFALHHAEATGRDRILVALPYLSILDQTTDVYRSVFEPSLGVPSLIEHHSSVTKSHDTVANRLAAENWDAPLIVTTQVQLFESLFSRRPGHCRKLHRLANAVVLLDEIQTLPVELLAPILDQLQQLRTHYGTALVLMTATQPALHSRRFPSKAFEGLDPAPLEIVPSEEMASLFETLRRVEVEWPRQEDPVAWADVAAAADQHDQVLVVVHRRADAAELYRLCAARRGDGWIHLSALMCPAHRREVLAEVRSKLAGGLPCRVVSTQLVEAGVDVDFPVVFRAMAGLESLAQSAGRCNREGKLAGGGHFVVFNPGSEPPGLLKQHRDVARMLLAADPDLDLLTPATFRRYFDILYEQRSLDARGIQALRAELRFEEVARRFEMIDSAGETVFVPYGLEGQRAVDAVRYGGPSLGRFRALQPFGVTVYPDSLRKLVAEGAVTLLHESVHVLSSDIHYDRRLGLVVEPEPFGATFA